MRKTLALVAAAMITLTACTESAAETPVEEKEELSHEATVEPTASEPSTFHVQGLISIGSEDVTKVDADTCIPNNKTLASVTRELEGTQVIIKDAAGSIVGTSEFKVSRDSLGCNWGFGAKVAPGSDFYTAEFLDMTTPVADATGNTFGIDLDIATPIEELYDIEWRAQFGL